MICVDNRSLKFTITLGKGKVELNPVDALSPAAVEFRSENLLAMDSVTFHLSDNYLSLHRHVRYYIRINGELFA